MKLNVITMMVIVVALAVLGSQALRIPWTPMRVAGMAIAVPAFVFFTLARMQLGRSFSVEAKATALVTTGVYSRIRNPIYVFGALMILGVIVWTGEPWFLLVFVVLIPLQVTRAHKEALILEAKFGEAYVEYRKKTWF